MARIYSVKYPRFFLFQNATSKNIIWANLSNCISLPFDYDYTIKSAYYYVFEDVFEWCAKNCKGRWGYKISQEFFFKNKSDMILFKLRWI